MDRAGQLLVNVASHLMARDAELLGIGQLQRGVEGAQNITPPMKPPSVRKPRLSDPASVEMMCQTHRASNFSLCMAH